MVLRVVALVVEVVVSCNVLVCVLRFQLQQQGVRVRVQDLTLQAVIFFQRVVEVTYKDFAVV